MPQPADGDRFAAAWRAAPARDDADAPGAASAGMAPAAPPGPRAPAGSGTSAAPWAVARPTGAPRDGAIAPPAQAANAPARFAAPHAGEPWQARSVHVHVGEQATGVWVRDARLLPDEAVRLLERLRPLLAGAHEAQSSIRLTVNGRPVQDHRGGEPAAASEQGDA
jgi:hypothetical protein